MYCPAMLPIHADEGNPLVLDGWLTFVDVLDIRKLVRLVGSDVALG
jgi:hypothetical protein